MNKIFLVLITFFIVLSLGMPCTSSQAQDIYSDNPRAKSMVVSRYVAPQGNDSNDCASPTTPCATINAAVGKAAAGDVVYAASGTFTRNNGGYVVLIDKDITLSGGWNQTFDNQNGMTAIDGQYYWGGLRVEDGVNSTLIRLDIKNGGPTMSGLSNSGIVSIQDSSIQNSQGGGVENILESELTMINTIVKSNGGRFWGGGIWNEGSLTLIRSGIMGNSATMWGGGIYSIGPQLTIVNSTIGLNQAGSNGGGIELTNMATADLYNSTIVGNISSSGAGGLHASESVSLSMQNSILAKNIDQSATNPSPDCDADINSGGYNLIGDTTGCNFIPTVGDLLNILPLTFPMSANFGLYPSSPAIDAGNPAGCLDHLGNPLLEDQRGSIRPLDGNGDGTSTCDIGAYEFDSEHHALFTFLPIGMKPCPVLYYDDFGNPSSGWPVLDNGNILLEYNHGEYRILVRPTQYGVAVRPGVQATDYKVSVDLRNTSGVSGSYGIAFGITQEWSKYYSLSVLANGWYAIVRHETQSDYTLAEGFSPYIHQGTASNSIRIELIGELIRAYANGHLLASVSDPYIYGPTYMGLITISENSPDVDIRYDNFRVDPIECQNLKFADELQAELQTSWIESPQSLDGIISSPTTNQP